MLGDSHEDVGFDLATRPEVMQEIAARNIAALPKLAEATVVRVWAALRVMTPDGYPIYEQSARYPGATLPNKAPPLVRWIKVPGARVAADNTWKRVSPDASSSAKSSCNEKPGSIPGTLGASVPATNSTPASAIALTSNLRKSSFAPSLAVFST